MADGILIFDTKIDISGFQQDAKKLEKSGSSILDGVAKKFFSDIGSKAAKAILDFGKESVLAASSLQETQSLLDATFGKNTYAVDNWAKSAQQQFGLTEAKAKQSVLSMNTQLKSTGLSDNDARQMSTQLTGLAADMASFYNLDFGTVFQGLQSGMAGNADALSQMGISLSEANLEAFALSKGMKQSYRSLSEAEQAALRYQYVMQETADVQGDFVQNSDGLANGLTLLESNWDTLKTHVGEALLPLASSTVNLLNGLFEAMDPPQTLDETLSSIQQNYESSAAAIERNQLHANALTKTLAELEGKESLTAEETLRVKGATQALVDIYPELGKYVDESAGRFTVSASAIADETKSLSENALVKARAAANEEKLAAAAKAVVEAEDDYAQKSAEATKTSADYENAYARYYEERQKLRGELAQKLYGLLSSGFIKADADQVMTAVDLMVDKGISASAAFDAAFGYNMHRLFPEELSAIAVGNTQAMQEASAAAAALRPAFEEANKQLEASSEALDAANAAYQEAADGITNATDATAIAANQMPQTEQVAKSMAEAVGAALNQLAEPAGKVSESLNALSQYRLENLAQVRSQLDSTFGLFEKPDSVRKQSIEKDTGNMEDQAAYWERYNAAVEALQNREGGDEWVAELADGSEESLGKLEMLAAASDDAYAKANGAREAAKANMDAAAESVNESKLAVDETYQSLQQSMAEAIAGMNQSAEAFSAAEATAQGLIDGLLAKAPGLGAAVGVLNGLMSKLGSFASAGFSFGDGGDGTGGDEKSPSRAKGPIIRNGWNIARLATGLSYVPYDEFPAFLHEGEAVLTKAEASLWRAGWAGTHITAASPTSPGSTDVGGGTVNQVVNFNLPVQTPDEFAKTMRLYATYGMEGMI